MRKVVIAVMVASLVAAACTRQESPVRPPGSARKLATAPVERRMMAGRIEVEGIVVGRVPALAKSDADPASFDWPTITRDAVTAAETAAGAFDLGGALSQGTELVRRVDGYINATEPFKLAKRVEAEPAAKDQLAAILYNCSEALRIASLLLSPAMPDKMADLWRKWTCAPAPSIPLSELARFGGPHALKPGQAIEKGEALFMRADTAEPPPTAS